MVGQRRNVLVVRIDRYDGRKEREKVEQKTD